MTTLLLNIVNYYIKEIMEREGVGKETATRILEDALQDEVIDGEILDFANINKNNYIED